MNIKHKLQQSLAIIFILTLAFAMFPGNVGAEETDKKDSADINSQSKAGLDEYPVENGSLEQNKFETSSDHEDKNTDGKREEQSDNNENSPNPSDDFSKEDNSEDNDSSNENDADEDSEDENDSDAHKETVESEQKTNSNSLNNYDEVVERSVEKAVKYTLDNGVVSEWEAIAIARAGYEVPDEYKDVFYNAIDNQVVNPRRLKMTDIERLAMAAQVMNLNPLDINDLNLIEMIYNSEDNAKGSDIMTFQGNNGPIFALIALDSGEFSVPEDARWTREKLINYLLEEQNEDGSWSLFGTDPSYDITAMALIALGNYKNDEQVSKAINKAVYFLSESQNEEGGFYDRWNGGISLETAAQVMIGLTSVDIDPLGEDFTKKNGNLLDHILTFIADDNGFKHLPNSNESNEMATEQGLQALVAYQLYMNKENGLYYFFDDEEIEDDLDLEDEGKDGEDDTESGQDQQDGEDDSNAEEDKTEGENDSESEKDKTELENDSNSEEIKLKGEADPESEQDKMEVDNDSNSEENNEAGEDNTELGQEKPEVEDSSELEVNKTKIEDDSTLGTTDEQIGDKLPKTATHTYTLIFVGILLLLLSSLIFITRKLRITR